VIVMHSLSFVHIVNSSTRLEGQFMSTRRHALALLLSSFVLAAACGKDANPNAPSGGGQNPPTPTANRTIELGGPLVFGAVNVGEVVERELRINNRGTDPLTVTRITGPAGPFSVSWSSGTINGGGVQAVTIRFSPTEAGNYSGTVTVEANHTAGTNTIPMTASGVVPPPPPRPRWSATGTGDSVLDMPGDVRRVRIIGTYNGHSSNFIVKIAGRLIVNEIIGTDTPFTIGPRYQGDHLLTSGGVVQITNSSGVAWSFEELR